jgi:CRP-like cAMP-binding protein
MAKELQCTGVTVENLPNNLREGTEAHSAFCSLVLGNRRESTAGSILKLEGEETTSVFFILSGWVYLSKSLSDGQRQIIDVVLPGGLVETISADRDTSALEVVALTDVSLARIPRQLWHRACAEHPELANLADQEIGSALSRISERMVRLGKAAAETTIAFALCELCLRSSARGLVENAEFHIPMTQQHLGDLCGLSAVHICRTLRRLKRLGVLTVTDHMNILVHDMDALAEIAEIDPEALKAEIVPAA